MPKWLLAFLDQASTLTRSLLLGDVEGARSFGEVRYEEVPEKGDWERYDAADNKKPLQV